LTTSPRWRRRNSRQAFAAGQSVRSKGFAAYREGATLNSLDTLDGPNVDQLQLNQVPLVPEVRLFLADDAIILWARLEAQTGQRLPAPFWASAWIGGQALARYILDHPDTVAGRSVLDVACGSGVVAIAAAMAGARSVAANDVDPYAIAAMKANAAANDVAVTPLLGDILDGDGDAADVVLVGDALYDQSIAGRVMPFLKRAATRGARVLVGDPGRGHVPADQLEMVASYAVSVIGSPEDALLERTSVFAVRGAHPGA
jgi:predicted nicotinamide N-methyase